MCPLSSENKAIYLVGQWLLVLWHEEEEQGTHGCAASQSVFIQLTLSALMKLMKLKGLQVESHTPSIYNLCYEELKNCHDWNIQKMD